MMPLPFLPERLSNKLSPSGLVSVAYRAARRAIVLDISRVLWLERSWLAKRVCPDPRYVFRFLTAQDTLDYAVDPANCLEPAFAARLLGGNDLCYAALDGDSLASYLWLALGSIEAEQHRGKNPKTGVAISFPPEVAFIYKAFTRTEHRGRRLYPACIANAFAELAPLGIRQLFSSTDWTNRAALQSFYRVGFRDLGLTWRFGLGNLLVTLPPAAARNRGIRFDQQAVVDARPGEHVFHELAAPAGR